MKRRSFLLGLTGALAAPAIVRADSLMKLWMPPAPQLFTEQALLGAFTTAAMKIRRTETWHVGYDTWRRVYFDEDRQQVISEQVFPERPFVLYGGPAGGSMADA